LTATGPARSRASRDFDPPLGVHVIVIPGHLSGWPARRFLSDIVDVPGGRGGLHWGCLGQSRC
jgi:hypothetical protein